MEMVEKISNIHRASEETARAAQSVAEQSEAMSNYSQSLIDALSRFKLNTDRSDKGPGKKISGKKNSERKALKGGSVRMAPNT
jgi:hypothetical protein